MADDGDNGRWRRLLWFGLFWCAGVVTVAVIAWLIRLALGIG